MTHLHPWDRLCLAFWHLIECYAMLRQATIRVHHAAKEAGIPRDQVRIYVANEVVSLKQNIETRH